MKRKLVLFIISGVVLILLCSLSWICFKRYCKNRDLSLAYEAGLTPVTQKENGFYPKASLVFYDSVLKTETNPRKQRTIRYYEALTMLKTGQEAQAIDILKMLMGEPDPDNDIAMQSGIEKNLALAYLRLAEKNNCFSNHTAVSCIFPIQGSGIYKDPSVSHKSIETYLHILAKDSADLESRWLLNLAYMTVGEYPRLVPVKWLIPGLDKDTSAYKINAFQNMAGALKMNTSRNQAGGTIIDDFNGDGYLDIVTSSWDLEEAMHFYKNNGDGSFTDMSKESGLDKIKGGLNLIQADYNNDGYTDILVIRGGWMGEFGKQPKTLLKNNGNGHFTDVTLDSGILSYNPTQTAQWADFNNDGWLDLFIGNETRDKKHPHPSDLFINNQDGTFTNVAAEAGCAELAFMKGVAVGDYNNDGWPDIFISDLDGRKKLLKNRGLKSRIPSFENTTHVAGLDKDTTKTFPTWFWDYNNDGWPDLFICGFTSSGSFAIAAATDALGRPIASATSTMYLYRNNHDGTFTNVTKETGLDKPVFSMGSNFGDIDNDGWPDMYLGTGRPDLNSLLPNRMFKNIDGKKFTEVTYSARVGNLQKGHGVAFADLDNDGDQDIFIEVGGAFTSDAYFNSLYVNPGQNNNNWISILLEGTQSNRSAIGAHIILKFNDSGMERTVYMDVNSGGSFGANPFRKEIGIGKATIIDELTIRWPTTGIVQVFKNVRPRQFIRIKEGSNELFKMNLQRLNFMDKADPLNMIDCFPAKT